MLPFEGQIKLPDTSIFQPDQSPIVSAVPKKRPREKKPRGLKRKTTVTRTTTRTNRRTVIKTTYRRTEEHYRRR
jgi:hypothetical protein